MKPSSFSWSRRWVPLALVLFNTTVGAACSSTATPEPVPGVETNGSAGSNAGASGRGQQAGQAGIAGASGTAGLAGNAGSSGGTTQPNPPLDWQACPKGFQTECARVPVPLDWNNPQGESTEVFVSRRLSGVTGAPQLWLLQGGPGGSGDAYEPYVNQIASFFPPIDIYVLEHRGVGESGRLECPEQELETSPDGAWINAEEIPTCLSYLQSHLGEKLSYYSTTQAANDLGYMIAQTQSANQPSFVLGVSYGTYWAHRYLQLFPKQPSGIILDSIAPPGISMHTFTTQVDKVAKDFLSLCSSNELCSEKIGPDPWKLIGDLFAKIDQSHCSELGFTSKSLRATLGTLIRDYFGRENIAAFVYRLARCNEQDVEAILHFFQTLTPDPTQVGRPFGNVLYYNVAHSELWSSPLDIPTLQSELDSSYFGSEFALDLAKSHNQWPVYTITEDSKQLTISEVPMLMLNGTMDPQTPLEEALVAKEHFQGAHQTFLTFPQTPHAVIATSYTGFLGEPTCGLSIVNQFIQKPTGKLNLSCMDDVVPAEVAGRKEYATYFWNVPNAFENPAQPVPSPNPQDVQAPPRNRWFAHSAPFSRTKSNQ
jgi:pimeloyl-ACP methyl ester carboxylesterase